MESSNLTKTRRSLLAAACVLSILAGGVVSAAAQDLTGDIRFSWWGGPVRNQKTDQIIQLFEERNPGVSISRENSEFEAYWERLTIQSAGNNQPCAISAQSRWLGTFSGADVLMPLDDLVSQGVIDVSGIPEPVLDAGRGSDGKLYMVPYGVFYFALMYNMRMEEEAVAQGVEPLEWPYDWEEYAAHLRAVQPTLADGVDATHNMGRETDAFIPWVQSHGEQVFEGNQLAFSRETVIAWFNYWEALRNEGVTEPAEMMIGDTGALIEESALAVGRGYTTNRSPNLLAAVQRVADRMQAGSTIGLRPFPVGPGGTSGMDLGANGIAIGANCTADQIPATAAWINFWVHDPDASAIFQSDNGVVSVPELAQAQIENPETESSQVMLIELYKEVADTAMPVQWPPGSYQGMTETLYRAYDGVAFGQMTADEAADQFMAELQQQITAASR